MFERFDYETYRRVLRWVSDDRPCVGFPTAVQKDGQPYCLVRHDVDFSLPAALAMAEVEAELGITATYFLLFSGPHYNLLAGDNPRVARTLIELGHEVGLHYDSRAVDGLPPEEALETLQAEARLLEMLGGAPITAIARHNPGMGGEDPFERVPGFINAYEPRFTSQIAYVSDSCGAWREEALALLTAEEPPRNMQLLIHPLFWDERATDRWTHLERLRKARVADVEKQIALTRDVWKGHAGAAQHDRRIEAAMGERAPSQ